MWQQGGRCGKLRAKVTSCSKQLPNDVSRIAPHLLSQILIKKFVLHQLHSWWAIMGQLLLISTKICPRHSFVANALWMTNQRKVVSFHTLCVYQVILQFTKVEGGISFRYLLEIGFLGVFWVVIDFLPMLAKYTMKWVISSHCHLAMSMKIIIWIGIEECHVKACPPYPFIWSGMCSLLANHCISSQTIAFK